MVQHSRATRLLLLFPLQNSFAYFHSICATRLVRLVNLAKRSTSTAICSSCLLHIPFPFFFLFQTQPDSGNVKWGWLSLCPLSPRPTVKIKSGSSPESKQRILYLLIARVISGGPTQASTTVAHERTDIVLLVTRRLVAIAARILVHCAPPLPT